MYNFATKKAHPIRMSFLHPPRLLFARRQDFNNRNSQEGLVFTNTLAAMITTHAHTSGQRQHRGHSQSHHNKFFHFIFPFIKLQASCLLLNNKFNILFYARVVKKKNLCLTNFFTRPYIDGQTSNNHSPF